MSKEDAQVKYVELLKGVSLPTHTDECVSLTFPPDARKVRRRREQKTACRA
jgi:hypothetical protein